MIDQQNALKAALAQRDHYQLHHRHQHPSSKRPPWNWHMLLNGKMEELLYDLKSIATRGLPLADLKKSAHINSVAQAARNDPDFSKLIRIGTLPADK